MKAISRKGLKTVKKINVLLRLLNLLRLTSRISLLLATFKFVEAHLQDQFAPRKALYKFLATFKLVTRFRWIIPSPIRWICSRSIRLTYTVLLTNFFSMKMLSVNVTSHKKTTRCLLTETKSMNKNLRWMCIRQKKHNSDRLQYPESIQESNRAVVRAGAQLLRSHPQPTRTTYNCNFKNCRYYLHIKWFRAKRMSRA